MADRVTKTPGARLTFNINWKTIAAILGVLGAGTGTSFGIARCATTQDVKAAERRIEQKIDTESGVRETGFIKFDARLKVQEKSTEDLAKTVGQVQEVQHWQVADQAAEMVSKEAPKHKREEKRRDLFKWNMRRLKHGQMPCTNLDCSN
jgi:hypothetical protein